MVTQTSNLGTAVGTKNVRRPKGYAPLPAYEGKSTESASLHCCRGHAFRDRAQGAQRRLRDFYHALLAIIIHIFRSKADPGLGGRFRRLQQTIDVLEDNGDLLIVLGHFAGQLFVGVQRLAKTHEGAHDVNVHLHRPFAGAGRRKA